MFCFPLYLFMANEISLPFQMILFIKPTTDFTFATRFAVFHFKTKKLFFIWMTLQIVYYVNLICFLYFIWLWFFDRDSLYQKHFLFHVWLFDFSLITIFDCISRVHFFLFHVNKAIFFNSLLNLTFRPTPENRPIRTKHTLKSLLQKTCFHFLCVCVFFCC